MKKIYSEPEMMISAFSSESIVTSSTGTGYTSTTTDTEPEAGASPNSISWGDFSIDLIV